MGGREPSQYSRQKGQGQELGRKPGLNLVWLQQPCRGGCEPMLGHTEALYRQLLPLYPTSNWPGEGL
jgi:hypothetical protein